MRRLNRFRYKNAIRDLLALDDFPKEMDISLLLPPDDIGGFRQHGGRAFVSLSSSAISALPERSAASPSRMHPSRG